MAQSERDKRTQTPGGPQLEFGEFIAPAGRPELSVRRRDGRVVPFDATRLAGAIAEIAQPGERLDRDTAYSLAQATALYLRRTQVSGTVAAERIAELTEGVLAEMGYSASARAYGRRFGDWARHARHWASGAASAYNAAVGPADVETVLERVAIEAGLERAGSAELIARIKEQIGASGLKHVTTGLLREWFVAALYDQQQASRAERALQVSVPTRVIEEAFEGEGTGTTDPERAALRISEHVSASYALNTVVPRDAVESHLRGAIRILGLGHALKLDSLRLDLEGLKQQGPTSGMGGRNAPPAAEPDVLIVQLAAQSEILRRYVYRRLTWASVNFGIAPYLADVGDDDLRALAQVLVFEFARRAARRSRPGQPVELELSWDAPDTGGSLYGPGGRAMPTGDAFEPARRFFDAVLDVLAELAAEGRDVDGAAFSFRLSPYFFGSPQADLALERIGRIAAGPARIRVQYDAATPLEFDVPAMRSGGDAIGQTVLVDLARPSRLVPDADTLIAQLDNTIDVAVAAHVGKHRFLERVYRHRSGPLGLLRQRFGTDPLVDPDTLKYRVALTGLADCVRTIVGEDWGVSPAAAELAERIVGHVKEACDRWSLATKRSIVAVSADSYDAQVTAAWSGGRGEFPDGAEPPLNAYGDRSGLGALLPDTGEDSLVLVDRVGLEAALHPLFGEGPCTWIPVRQRELSPEAIGALIRSAFLGTPCRGLCFD